MEQAFIDAVQAGVAQAVQAAGQAPPQQAAVFGLTPAPRANPDDIVDHTTKVGIAALLAAPPCCCLPLPPGTDRSFAHYHRTLRNGGAPRSELPAQPIIPLS